MKKHFSADGLKYKSSSCPGMVFFERPPIEIQPKKKQLSLKR